VARASLLVIEGAAHGTRFEIGEGDFGIGRGSENQATIQDTEISRQHVVINHADGAFTLTDLDSSNGTLVNGVPVRTCRLGAGDQVQVGRTVMLFSLHDEARSPAAPALPVGLVGRTGDRSSIVSRLDQRAGRELLAFDSLQAMYRISDEIVRPAASPTHLLERLLDVTLEVIGADRGCVLLKDSDSDGCLVPRAFAQRPGTELDEMMPIPRSIVDHVLDNAQGVLTSDAMKDERFGGSQSIVTAGVREAMCAPLAGRQALLGVLYVDTTTRVTEILDQGGSEERFSEDQLRLLIAIGHQAALAIEGQRYQQALVKAERLAAVGQTIASLSHHIKNILQGVRGGSYLINLGLDDHDEEMIRKGWRIVDRNQGRIYDLVMDMLTFSTDRQPALQLASVNDTVRDVCEMTQELAQEADVDLLFDEGPEIPATRFDPEGIHRAVLNLVNNAIEAVEDRPDARVNVTTGIDDEAGRIVVEVQDNGPGIDPELLPRLFQLFESTKGARGTGLGLAVSRKIIREHGGEIEVNSPTGGGTCFRLSWPLADEDLAGERVTGTDAAETGED